MKILHSQYMKRALVLASLGMKKTSPNPMVGCVIVKDGNIIAEGWHKQYGGHHAEIEALNDAYRRGEDVRGSTVYVTLEPCSHYGKTPPCADRLVREGVAEVVIAMRDPNPKVDGKGIEILRDSGITVTELPEFQDEAKYLNRGFVFVQKYGRPFITLKAAMSLDGRMCLANGSSKWITGIEARTKAHSIRAENDAVLVGVGTVLADNPELTVRHVTGINPLRVVLDTHMRTPSGAKVIGSDGKCVILTCSDSGLEGAEVVRLPEKDGHIDLHEAVKYLAGRGILTLMIEGGPEVISSFLREGLADYVNIFYSPRILGEGKGININSGFNSVNEALRLKNMNVIPMGKDIMIEGRIECSPDL